MAGKIEIGSNVFGNNNEIFSIVDHLDDGGFGNIFIVERNKIPYILKVLQETSSKTKKQTIFNEAELCLRISHRNVIEFVFFHDGNTYPDFPPYIIMEYAKNGSLDKLIFRHKNKKKFFSNVEILDIFDQLSSGMYEINTVNQIIHRDIKPQNILIFDSTYKISDFGLSKIISEKTRDITFKGLNTYLYRAPEEWGGDQKAISMDIYAMGIVFYQIVTLNYPYYNFGPDSDIEDIRQAHKSGDQIPIRDFNPNIDNRIEILIKRMIAQDVRKRISSWEEILSIIRSCTDKNVTVNNGQLIEKSINLFERQLEKEKKVLLISDKAKERQKIVNKQIHEIFLDLLDLIKSFNNSQSPYKIKSMALKENQFPKEFYLDLDKNRNCRIEYKILQEDDVLFIDDEVYKRYSLIQSKIIRCFGFLKIFNGMGFNFFLSYDDENIDYGDMVIMENHLRPDVYNNFPRPSPFPFELHEFPLEIYNLTGIDDYIYFSNLSTYHPSIWEEYIALLFDE